MAGKNIVEINADKYQDVVLGAERAVLDFYSTECPPCEALAAKYEGLAEIYGKDIKFVKIFRQGNRELAEELGVTGSPTVIFYEKGKEVGNRLAGGIKRSALMAELDAMLPADRVKELHAQIKPIETETDVLVFGAGPAGLTAGLYLGQAHIDTTIVDPQLSGGYVATTHMVSNYPAFPEPQNGMMIAHYMSEQTKRYGARFKEAVEITDIDLENKTCVIDGLETVKAKKIVIASGSRPRPLGLPGEQEFAGNGISYCATCDGKYFEDQEIVVIGGGNSAIEESLFLTTFASKITIVHQFDELQANKEAQEKAFANEKIEFKFSHEPREFKKYGPNDMGLVVENLKTGETEELRTAGIFVFVGFIPNLEDFGDNLAKDDWGYVKTDGDMRTNIADVYAAGDVATKKFRQITTAVSDGTIAAINISKELAG
jgi:thioredoxin reductase (NADPH)